MIAGCVYVIGPELGKPIKIGIASDPQRRLYNLSSPFVLRLWFSTVPIDDPRTVEKACHVHFADRRLNGEWFDVDAYEAEMVINAITQERKVCNSPERACRYISIQLSREELHMVDNILALRGGESRVSVIRQGIRMLYAHSLEKARQNAELEELVKMYQEEQRVMLIQAGFPNGRVP